MPSRTFAQLAAQPVRSTLRRMGLDVVRRPRSGARASRRPRYPVDLDETTVRIIEAIGDATLTTPERMASLVESVRYVVRNEIPGTFVECGVWRGGSMMAVALTLRDLGVEDRDVYLYDTFTHMPYPGEKDVDHNGRHASEYYDEASEAEAFRYLSFEQVQQNLHGTGYPTERIHFVKGMVEDTIPDRAPAQIALCRLDTDWYESTRHEMVHLWPRLAAGGVLIVDDYGHFQGCQEAVDEYFEQQGLRPFLHRIDYSGRLVLKPTG